QKCDFCGSCVAVCKTDALILLETSMQIEQDQCTACGRCVIICPFRALTLEDA
ncbi:MAG: 4Fe-4S ferredoxin, partial [Candidatus Raymondbacteria bacterium RifOxyB12_full_50_8]